MERIFKYIDLSDKEFTLFSSLIYDKAGINLGLHKKELLKNRLRKRMRELDIDNFKSYFKYITEVDKSGEELSIMLTAISTNVTYFFREDNHFKLLSEKILPELVASKQAKSVKTFKVWSAGCSSGEEPYTLSITLQEFLKNKGYWNIYILGTDISHNALEKAKRGVYKVESTKHVPDHLLRHYFLKGYDEMKNMVKVKKHVKEVVDIEYLNFKDDSYSVPGNFDFIFCRNVLIYFDKETQAALINKFKKHLVAGGHLFLGHSEGLTGRLAGLKHIAPSVYVKTE
ncbi:MAG: protein-glutamate O-methyltransferase CheR [Deltaproteobacteria bacterium]|nr:protein-glutamate O-methyltransferase CheR [Deltaproteobacteria bacterium]